MQPTDEVKYYFSFSKKRIVAQNFVEQKIPYIRRKEKRKRIVSRQVFQIFFKMFHADNRDKWFREQVILLISTDQGSVFTLTSAFIMQKQQLSIRNDIYGYMTRCWINIERRREASIAVLFILARQSQVHHTFRIGQ